ncbi:MAG: hypothetical protein MJZ61_04095 [Bacteroidales bacterium]|nr:hypothetical protein [Bacteroidales bacterium]
MRRKFLRVSMILAISGMIGSSFMFTSCSKDDDEPQKTEQKTDDKDKDDDQKGDQSGTGGSTTGTGGEGTGTDNPDEGGEGTGTDNPGEGGEGGEGTGTDTPGDVVPDPIVLNLSTKAGELGGHGWGSEYSQTKGVITYEGAWKGRGWWLGGADYSDYTDVSFDVYNVSVDMSVQLVVEYGDGIEASKSIVDITAGDDTKHTITVTLDPEHKNSIAQIYIQSSLAGKVAVVQGADFTEAESGTSVVKPLFENVGNWVWDQAFAKSELQKYVSDYENPTIKLYCTLALDLPEYDGIGCLTGWITSPTTSNTTDENYVILSPAGVTTAGTEFVVELSVAEIIEKLPNTDRICFGIWDNGNKDQVKFTLDKVEFVGTVK